MDINFGIIGCGRIAQRHARHISQHAEAKLVSSYDIDIERSTAFGLEFGGECAKTNDAFLGNKEIDIVNICTPNGLHHNGAIEALKSGKHVLVEKPMALSKAHCEEMINEALKANKQLFVVKQNRFNPPIMALHKLVNSGKLGKIFQVVVNCFWNRNLDYYNNSDWKGTKDLDGGTLFTQFSHFVDILYYLFGDVEVGNGLISNDYLKDIIEFEDTGNFVFAFKSGGIGSFNYTTSSYGQNMEGSITVFAENATIKVGGKYLNTLEYQSTNNFNIENLPTSGPSNNYGSYQGSMSNHDKIIENVVDVLNQRGSIMTNAMEGLKVVEIIENFYNSAKWV